MFERISSTSCLLILMLFRDHQAEITVLNRLIQGRNNVTRVGVEPDHAIRVVVKTTLYPFGPVTDKCDGTTRNKIKKLLVDCVWLNRSIDL